MGKLQKDESGFSAVEVVIVLVIIALIGVVGWFVYHNNHKTTASVATTANTKPATTAKTTSPTPKTVDPTAGWATYTSSLGGFSFKYPATGWTLEAYDNNSSSWVTGSAITGNESELAVNENSGQGLSTSSLQYGIKINVGSASNVDSNNGQVTYSLGSVTQTLSNGIKLWQTSEDTFNNSNVPKCGANGVVELAAASGSNLYTPLPNGKYLNYTAGFCQGPGQKLSLSYQQQVNDTEMTVAKEILASYKF